MSSSGDFGGPLRKFKLVFLGEQSGESDFTYCLLLDLPYFVLFAPIIGAPKFRGARQNFLGYKSILLRSLDVYCPTIRSIGVGASRNANIK